MAQHEDTRSTRDRILDAAEEIFLESGYRLATVRDICGLARVNISAVKYHFQDKEGLYLAVLDRLFQVSVDKHPILLHEMSDRSAKDRLGHLIRVMLARILGKDNDHPDPRVWELIARELTTPSPIMRTLAEKHLLPFKDMLWDIVAELLDLPLDHPAVKDCASSIGGQYTHYLYNRNIINLFNPGQPVSADDLDRLAKHITDFSLAGIDSAREQHHQQG